MVKAMHAEQSAEPGNSGHRIAAVVLAAGEATRFGAPKQLVPVEGEPMLARVTRQVKESPVGRVVVVLGYEFEAISLTLANMTDVAIVRNPDYESGMASSARAGLDAAGDSDAIMFVLADLPGLAAEDIGRVAAAYRNSAAPLALGMCKGRPAHPVIFRKELWPELRQLKGDIGGREIVRKYLDVAATVELPETAIADIDTVKDYLQLQGGGGSG
jgi:molybdenum cofactor cytidylyltransferase